MLSYEIVSTGWGHHRIFGVSGKTEVIDTTEVSNPAVAGNLVLGKKAFVNGAAVIGTVSAGANVTGANGVLSIPLPDGFYTGGKTVTATDTNLITGNIRSGVSIFGVAGNSNVVNTGTGTAVATEIMTGKKAWIAGTEVTGTLPIQTLNPASTAVPAGYYAATNLTTVDSDLAPVNIKAGVSIFGVTGDSNVVNTSSGTAVAGDILIGKKAWVAGSDVIGTMYPAPVSKTGQTVSFATSDDGALQKGVTVSSSRFTDNQNGTVTDNLTGLVWLKKANCFVGQTWENAISSANNLSNSTCELLDGSATGQWRLPNLKEIQSLMDYGNSIPALPSGHPFLGVDTVQFFWTSTRYAYINTQAWVVDMWASNIYPRTLSTPYAAWPVRGGQ